MDTVYRDLALEAKDHVARENYFAAMECYQIILQRCPDDFHAHFNLGSCLHNMERFAQALPYWRESKARHDNFTINLNIGITCNCLALYDEAETAFRAALAYQPEHPAANYQLMFALLGQGKYPEGWQQNLWRQKTDNWKYPEPFPGTPIWQGEKLADDQTLAIFQEQGLGDTLMFLRFIPAIRERVKHIIFVGPPALHSVVERNFSLRAFSPDDVLPSVASQCPTFDIPGIIGCTIDNIPKPPYLFADPQKVVQWQEKMSVLPLRPNVGLVWAGGRVKQKGQIHYDSRRSFPFETYKPLFDAAADRVNFIAAQTDDSVWQSRTSGFPVHDWSDDIKTFDDTAALLANLDVLISVDTSIANLAGAMGTPLWLVNRHDTCWRWFPENRTPWYDKVREFRQPTPGDWTSVMARISSALTEPLFQFHPRTPDPTDS